MLHTAVPHARRSPWTKATRKGQTSCERFTRTVASTSLAFADTLLRTRGGREHQHLDPLGERRPERDVVASVMPFEGLKTTEKLRDLGEVNSAWAGIYSPCYSDATVARYIQRQFLEDADVYLERYQATGYWRGLLSAAQQFYSLKRGPTPPRIFDLGSGGGNTVLPLLELYPEAQVVASDLSLPLLKALRATLAERYPSRPLLCPAAERRTAPVRRSPVRPRRRRGGAPPPPLAGASAR